MRAAVEIGTSARPEVRGGGGRSASPGLPSAEAAFGGAHARLRERREREVPPREGPPRPRSGRGARVLPAAAPRPAPPGRLPLRTY